MHDKHQTQTRARHEIGLTSVHNAEYDEPSQGSSIIQIREVHVEIDLGHGCHSNLQDIGFSSARTTTLDDSSLFSLTDALF
jgi:hypothetical protein